MILVDIFVPSIDMTYNFSVDEEAPIGALIEEVLEMVERKEQTAFFGDRNKVLLVDRLNERVLPKEYSLLACSIATGSTLILI